MLATRRWRPSRPGTILSSGLEFERVINGARVRQQAGGKLDAGRDGDEEIGQQERQQELR